MARSERALVARMLACSRRGWFIPGGGDGGGGGGGEHDEDEEIEVEEGTKEGTKGKGEKSQR